MRYLKEDFMDNVDDADIVSSDNSIENSADSSELGIGSYKDYPVMFELGNAFYDPEDGPVTDFFRKTTKKILRIFNSRFFKSHSKVFYEHIYDNIDDLLKNTNPAAYGKVRFYIGAEPNFKDFNQVLLFMGMCFYAPAGCRRFTKMEVNTKTDRPNSYDSIEFSEMKIFRFYQEMGSIGGHDKRHHDSYEYHVSRLYRLADVLVPRKALIDASELIQRKNDVDVFKRMTTRLKESIVKYRGESLKTTSYLTSLIKSSVLNIRDLNNVFEIRIYYCNNASWSNIYSATLEKIMSYPSLIEQFTAISL